MDTQQKHPPALQTGLVSVSYRNLNIDEIIALALRAGLDSIEWGGDIHVPHGDESAAETAAVKTKSAGLTVSAYGSYYRLGADLDTQKFTFSDTVRSTKKLGAKLIRVWAGNVDSALCSNEMRDKIIQDALRCADTAAENNMQIAYEFHGGTLTDTNESALNLLEQTEHPAVLCYWQPPPGKDPEYCLVGLRGIIERKKLANIHVYYWVKGERLLLRKGIPVWEKYITEINKAAGSRTLSLEFSRENNPEHTVDDADALKQIIGKK